MEKREGEREGVWRQRRGIAFWLRFYQGELWCRSYLCLLLRSVPVRRFHYMISCLHLLTLVRDDEQGDDDDDDDDDDDVELHVSDVGLPY